MIWVHYPYFWKHPHYTLRINGINGTLHANGFIQTLLNFSHPKRIRNVLCPVRPQTGLHLHAKNTCCLPSGVAPIARSLHLMQMECSPCWTSSTKSPKFVVLCSTSRPFAPQPLSAKQILRLSFWQSCPEGPGRLSETLNENSPQRRIHEDSQNCIANLHKLRSCSKASNGYGWLVLNGKCRLNKYIWSYPKHSMYGIFIYICMVNASKNTLHWVSGYVIYIFGLPLWVSLRGCLVGLIFFGLAIRLSSVDFTKNLTNFSF